MTARSTCSSAVLFCLVLTAARTACCENWPRWRGPRGNAVSSESPLPVTWSTTRNVRWNVEIPGEGSSSPIVWDERVFVTSSLEHGTRRLLHCLDRPTGRFVWSREIEDPDPELTSALTGHAAATPVTDGERIVAMFGNAGAVCYDFSGRELWRSKLGPFETELGLASSPVLSGTHVILVCDHDGDRFRTFDSFMIALDLMSGRTVWKTDRPKLYRSWSTPIAVPAGDARELVVNAQDELRGYDPSTGKLLWSVDGTAGWITSSPVFGNGLIYATLGKDGPTVAVRPGGRGKISDSHVVWRQPRGAPYVCSPLLLGDYLYVHNEQGILTCREARSGEVVYQERLEGRFIASPVAGDGKIYITSETGDTFVIQAGPAMTLLARNSLGEEILASAAISQQSLFLRTQHRLYCIAESD